MTESSLAQLTQAGLNSLSHTALSLIPSLSPANQPQEKTLEEDEDGIIKCFCAYQEDDGNTVLCEKCNTWQHIECYYASSDVPEIHECADCEPRVFDARKATERQNERQKKKREQSDVSLQPRIKKPPTRSHKKKTKAPEAHLLLNGITQDKDDSASSKSRAAANSKDHAQSVKTPRTNHKVSNSIHSSTVLPQSLAWGSKRLVSASASHNARSPSKSSHTNSPDAYRFEPYSPEFLHLYDNDPGEAPLKANLFNDITIADQLQSWSHDVEALGEVTNGKKPQEIFQRCDLALDSMAFPDLRKDFKQDESLSVAGAFPKWTMLRVDVDIPQNSIVGELKGQIGHMNSYVQDPTNRWDYLRHPAPFVFFHDQLPIYIDTRREGTICRYLRRSCRPNLSLKTFLEGADYHFCFVANQDLPAGTELTTGWRLDQHISSFLHGNDAIIKQEALEDSGRSYIADWVGKVFAEFGDCACDHPEGCIFQKYDPRSPSLVNEMRRGGKLHSLNQFPKQWSSSRLNNSRSGSEGIKHNEGEEDGRSLSGSTSRSPYSGDTTPTKLGSRINGGAETSDREKRKLADLERAFEQMEQKQNQPNKKRKRTSGGSTGQTSTLESKASNNVATSNMASQIANSNCAAPPLGNTNLFGKSHLVNGSRRANVKPKSTRTKPVYVDASTQTNPDSVNDIVNFIHRPPLNPPRYESLHKRLMRRAREQRILLSQMRDKWFADHPDHPETLKNRAKLGNISPHETINKAPLVNGNGPDNEAPEVQNSSFEAVPNQSTLPPQTKSSQSAPTSSLPFTKEPGSDGKGILPLPPESKALPPHRPNPLSVLLPPPPLLAAASKTSVSTSTTPPPIPLAPTLDISTMRTAHPYPPLPLPASLPSSSHIVQPSPVKKISLGDYMSRRSSHKIETLASNSAATPHERSGESTSNTAKEPIESSRAIVGEDIMLVDTPRVEELPDTAPIAHMAQHTNKEQWMDIDVPPQMA